MNQAVYEASVPKGQTLEQTEEIIAKGHPPMAEGVILVDFDGTIVKFGLLFDLDAEPLPGAIESLKRLKEAGYKIIIFTSRLSPIWLDSVGQTSLQHINYIRDYLARHDFEADGFTAQKVPSVAYIDDKAYRYDNNWKELTDTILGE